MGHAHIRRLEVRHRHAALLSGLAFSADGGWIATAGPTKAGVWEADSNLPDSFLYFVRGNVAPLSLSFAGAVGARDGGA